MTPEEREALLRQLGMRPAWQGTREARPGYQQQQSPAGALADPRTLPYRRVPTRRDREFSRAALQDTTQRGAYSEPRNQIAEAGMAALETTGAPSFARGVRSIQANEPGRAAGEFALAGLGLLGTATLPFGGGARAAPPRIPRIQQAMPEAVEALPNAPPRLPGRATDGSVLPIRPPEPIRQSLVGGSDDLREAAGMRPNAAPSGRTVESLDRLPQRVRTQLDGAREWARRQPRGGTASGLDDEQAFHSYIDLTQADIDAGVHHQIVRALGRMTNFEWGVALNGNRAQLTSNASPFWTPTFHRQMRPEGIEEFTHYHTTNAPLSPGDLAAADQYQRMSAVARNGRIDMRWPDDMFGQPSRAAPDGRSAQGGSDPRQVFIEGPNGSRLGVVFSAPNAQGMRSVSFGRSQGGEMSVGDAREMFRRVVQAIRDDAAENGAAAYRMSPDTDTPARARLYETMARTIEPPPGYTVRQDGSAVEIVRDPSRAQPNAGPPRPPPMFPGGRNR
jgi:hypothetical protein